MGRVGESTAAGQGLWTELDRPFRWADLLLPERDHEQLRTIATHAAHRSAGLRRGVRRPGIVLVFIGERGTGKTMAAQVLGAELGRAVFEVDLQGLEQRDAATIEPAFEAAEREDAIIVFDTNRPPSRAPGGARETARPAVNAAALARRCARHPGLVIFTWIPGENRGLALSDRVASLVPPSVGTTVRFPLPGAATRARIWRAELPSKTVLDAADLRQLANAFRVSGGAIKRCCTVARAEARARRVRLTPEIVTRAIEQECPDARIDEPTRALLHSDDPTARRDSGERRSGSRSRSAPRGRRRS